jgi:hypothetical protein
MKEQLVRVRGSTSFDSTDIAKKTVANQAAARTASTN